VSKKRPKRKDFEVTPEGRLGRRIPVDFSRLSESSRRSYGIPRHYEDIRFKCLGCGKNVIFPASQQQQWYEAEKRYFWERPNKCYPCYREWLGLRHEIAKFHRVLRNSPTVEELQMMLDKLERYRVLSQGKTNWQIYHRVKKLFDAAQEAEPETKL